MIGEITEIRWGIGGDSNTASASSGGCLMEAPTQDYSIKKKGGCQEKILKTLNTHQAMPIKNKGGILS